MKNWRQQHHSARLCLIAYTLHLLVPLCPASTYFSPGSSDAGSDITLLRPAGWMAAQARQVEGHAEVWVDFEELNAKGWAEVIEEAPCPPIAAGSGRVITATITHANDDVRTLTMSSGETLYVTGNHRMCSATQADWVPVKALRIGEELQTTDGRKSVASLGYQKGRHQVYNIEVETEHCYFVGNGEVLTHNGCDVTDTANQAGRRGNEETRADVDAQRDKIQAENPDWEHVGGGTNAKTGAQMKEMYIAGADDQRKGSTYPDLSFKKPDGTHHHHNTQDTYATGAPTKRESANESRLKNLKPKDSVSSSAKPKRRK